MEKPFGPTAIPIFQKNSALKLKKVEKISKKKVVAKFLPWEILLCMFFFFFGGFHSQSYISADQLAMEDKLSLGGDGMHYDASYMKKVTKHFMETVVKNFSNAANHHSSNDNYEISLETKIKKKEESMDDWTEATVVKVKKKVMVDNFDLKLFEFLFF